MSESHANEPHALPTPVIYCPICGFELYPEGRDSSDLMTSFDICPCCFCEFGFDDTAAYRAEWVAAGCLFHSGEHKPPNWSPEAQLKRADYSWHNPFSDSA